MKSATKPFCVSRTRTVDEAWIARIDGVLRHPAEYGLVDCCLCDERAALMGIFVPTESFARRIGQPEGKQRVVLYALCEPCSRLPDRNERVEQRDAARPGVRGRRADGEETEEFCDPAQLRTCLR
jgi:hypothetical protein